MVLNLENIFLQTTLLDWATFIAAMAAVVGIIITLTIEAIKMHRNTKAREVEYLYKFGKDLEDQLKKQGELTTQHHCKLFADDYLNMVERVAYLYRLNKIPREISDFFKDDMQLGLTLIKWYDKNKIINQDNYAHMTWPETIRFCRDHSLEPHPEDALPKAMLDLYHSNK